MWNIEKVNKCMSPSEVCLTLSQVSLGAESDRSDWTFLNADYIAQMYFMSGLQCSKAGSVESILVSLNIAINSHDRIKLKMRAYL